MTRVTAPISKLTRSLGSHPSVARPSYLSSASKAAGSLELSGDGRSSEPVDVSSRERPIAVPIASLTPLRIASTRAAGP